MRPPAARARSISMILTIIFWILWLLSVIGLFIPTESYPKVVRGSYAINLVLIGILGFKSLGDPLTK